MVRIIGNHLSHISQYRCLGMASPRPLACRCPSLRWPFCPPHIFEPPVHHRADHRLDFRGHVAAQERLGLGVIDHDVPFALVFLVPLGDLRRGARRGGSLSWLLKG